MPLFGKASFKAARKVPKRKADAGSTDPNQLITDKSALDPNLDFSQTPLKLSLGGQKMIFQNGIWIATDGMCFLFIIMTFCILIIETCPSLFLSAHDLLG